MGLFICDKCDVIENTACGFYWPSKDGERLCSQCADSTGFRERKFGKWHDEFERNIMTEEKIKEKLKIRPDYFIYLGRFNYLQEKQDEIFTK